MNATDSDPVLVVVQLTGGNDFMNTVIPYTNPLYHDARPGLRFAEDEVLPINNTLAFNPHAAPLKDVYDAGKMAIVQGVGYPDSSRSHFRSSYIWHTCEPETIATEGWLGQAIGQMDPDKENSLTGVNFGRGLPQSFVSKGVPVTSVGDLDNYGLLTGMTDRREASLERFKRMYAPAIGTGPVMDYLSETGQGVLSGADDLKKAPAMYESNVEYGSDLLGQGLRDAARVHLAGLGTRVLYVSHGDYDTHSRQELTHEKDMVELSRAIVDFFQDLEDHNAADNVLMLVWTEFGRRLADNGSGTDHGSGGGAFLIGNMVNGGLYAEYPSLEQSNLANGEDLAHTYDFRGLYSSILNQHLDLEPTPIVGGDFEQLQILN